jgi:hypothetical protein
LRGHATRIFGPRLRRPVSEGVEALAA